ncbi:LytTR family DNA-binding domain-containing protein [Luteimonas sp BLCC-B24]|uniref:LytR/AlgR family response regulator transcription factor n=1 Tax=Luteimonas sp. BLCC-B24 TaxID=3025317 RepID=UPI00234C24E0|nr:LytTR family DNA-binding domain-containing protein [Luteimonas sp. BLCC-B24]MDC7807833.1 LytTR family DNA-binding domain-containing protein [Luteimonas sp. BLCC-B24]
MKVVIADDEPLARERLRLLLAQLGGIDIVAEVGDGRSALEACAAHDPALVLLDIAMPGIDGLEVARHLSAFEPRPAVVFCTAYDAHALKAFEAAAVDYLVKPVRPERLQAAVERARTFTAGRASNGEGRGAKRRSHLCARLRGSLRLIPIEEIRYLQAEEKYVVVHHARGEDLVEESLKSLEDEFGDRFVRIHRNCLVARHELVELRRDLDGHVHAVLRHGDRPLEVSRRCVTQLRDTIRQL